MSFSHLWGAPAVLHDGDALSESVWYVQLGAKRVSCGLYRSAIGSWTLRIYRNGVEYYTAAGERDVLHRDAGEKLAALLAKGWEQIP